MEEVANRLSAVDYIIFISMLAGSAGIGIYHGCCGRGATNASEFLLAGRASSVVPVAMSLVASFLSAIGLLGLPAEVYSYGLNYSIGCLAALAAMVCSVYIFIPVFMDLKVTSIFQYLEKRFNSRVRKLASFLYALSTLFYISVAIYAPALALSQVTGLNVRISVVSVSTVVIFYTALGGMKAVLWTDVFQLSMMIGVAVLIAIKGTLDMGGIANIWQISKLGKRTFNIDFDPDPRVRTTIWGLFIGIFFHWLPNYAANQTQVQRYLCLPEKRSVIKAIWVNILGFTITSMTSFYLGLLIYSKFAACDPISSGLVSKADQMLPFFVMQSFGQWKGIPGLFVAQIFSGALSTVSSGLNSLPAIILEDYLKVFFPKQVKRINEAVLSKFLSLMFGILMVAFSFVAEQTDSVIMATYVMKGIINGPILGLFILGMLLPFTESWGACIGALGGMVITGWITIGSLVYKKAGLIKSQRLPVNVCSNFTIQHPWNGTHLDTSLLQEQSLSAFNSTVPEWRVSLQEDASFPKCLYELSFLWTPFIGCMVTVILGSLVSLLRRKRKSSSPDPRLLSPLLPKIQIFSNSKNPKTSVFALK